MLRRAAQEEWANDGVATLNELYGRDPSDHGDLAQSLSSPTQAQRACLSSIGAAYQSMLVHQCMDDAAAFRCVESETAFNTKINKCKKIINNNKQIQNDEREAPEVKIERKLTSHNQKRYSLSFNLG